MHTLYRLNHVSVCLKQCKLLVATVASDLQYSHLVILQNNYNLPPLNMMLGCLEITYDI